MTSTVLQRLAGSRASGIACAGMWLLTIGCGAGSAARQPSVEFSTIPEASAGGSERLAPIAGRVTGTRPGHNIVLFAKSGVWWVQPFAIRPFTSIDADSTWKSTTHLGTDYAALLVEPGYRPPATIESLPTAGGGVLAVATTKGTGTFTPPPRQTLTFSGYEWEVRRTSSDRGGWNDYDARNVSVDSEGHMHLSLVQRDGHWFSSEVKLTRALGYGTYAFVVRDTSMIDPAVALGMLTWDELGAEQNHRELDIEIGRWGDPGNKDAQYVVQPHYVAANVFRFLAPSGHLTHAFRWEPGKAMFWTLRGTGAVTVTPASTVAQRVFTSGVPVPGAEAVHINLLYFRSSPTPPKKDVEVVIEQFVYLP